MKKTVIFGNNIIAEMIYNDAVLHGSEFEFVAFTVDEEYLTGDTLCGLPQVSFEKALVLYPPSDFNIISSVYLTTRLRRRMEIFEKIKTAGYYMPNYISKLSDTPSDTVMGENNIVFAFTHIGLHGNMGDFNIIRQNVYLGHHFNISNGNIIASGCTLGGRCRIGNHCFIGVGAAVLDRILIADETLIGGGAVVTKDTDACTKYVGNPAKPAGCHNDTGIVIKVRGETTV
ncbi:MAG: hypothetical protein FWF51_02175 [Chitinivibrionia bacterium]|nr:hypothetical protein [Chitinivibrionia bacterium]